MSRYPALSTGGGDADRVAQIGELHLRIVNPAGRLGLVVADGVVDVRSASEGRFSPDPQAAYEGWDELREWAAEARGTAGDAVDARDAPNDCAASPPGVQSRPQLPRACCRGRHQGGGKVRDIEHLHDDSITETNDVLHRAGRPDR